jgi:hypothetical protein
MTAAVTPIQKHNDERINMGITNQYAAGETPRTLRDTLTDDRGDVPGWVLITLMTAGLVVAIWAIAGPALNNILDDSFSRVAGI